MISELVSKVFATRNAAHAQHWRTGSYSEHVALGAFYDDVIEAIDAVVENYQGMFGKLEAFDVNTPAAPDIRQYLTDEMDWIETNLDELSMGSQSISNLIQALISVYSKTLFLLSLK